MNANVGRQETVIVDERGRGKKKGKKGRSEGRDGMVLGAPLCLRWSCLKGSHLVAVATWSP